jgi:hypothetical protein
MAIILKVQFHLDGHSFYPNIKIVVNSINVLKSKMKIEHGKEKPHKKFEICV